MSLSYRAHYTDCFWIGSVETQARHAMPWQRRTRWACCRPDGFVARCWMEWVFVRGRINRTFLLVSAISVLLQGCASHPATEPLPPIGDISGTAPSIDTTLPPAQAGAALSVGSEIVIRAISLIGSPYRFGGSGPTSFDCSGLVRYVHQELGIEVPRTAAEQYRAATPVPVSDLEPGDLLFFRTAGKRISHVAIYAGSGRFVHAPQTGRPIEIRTLDDDYYRPRLAGAGRLF